MITEVHPGSQSIIFTLSAAIFCILRAAQVKNLPPALCSQKKSTKYKEWIKHLITQLTETNNYRTSQIISWQFLNHVFVLIIEKYTRAL